MIVETEEIKLLKQKENDAANTLVEAERSWRRIEYFQTLNQDLNLDYAKKKRADALKKLRNAKISWMRLHRELCAVSRNS